MNKSEKSLGKDLQGDLQPEQNVQSFIVKIWVEEISEDDTKKAWRGHITHVASGTRIHIVTMKEISNFILPYLKKIGYSC